MFGIAHGLHQVLEARRPTTVLGWAGSGTVYAARVAQPLRPRNNRLDENIVLSAVAKVVLVDEHTAGLPNELTEACLVLVAELRVFIVELGLAVSY